MFSIFYDDVITPNLGYYRTDMTISSTALKPIKSFELFLINSKKVNFHCVHEILYLKTNILLILRFINQEDVFNLPLLITRLANQMLF